MKILQQLSKVKYEEKLLELINLAEMFLCWLKDFSKIWEEKYDQKNNPLERSIYLNTAPTKYLILHTNLYYFEIVSILESLLHNGSKKEMSLKNYLNLNTNQRLKTEITSLKKEYKSSRTHKVRNQISDHKDKNSIGDPHTHFMLKINLTFIEEVEKFVRNLKTIASQYFNDRNNDLNSYFEDSRKLIVEVIRRLTQAS